MQFELRIYFFKEPPYKRISNQIVKATGFSGHAIGDIYLDLIPSLRKKKQQLLLYIGALLPKETSPHVYMKIKSGGGLYQRQQTRFSGCNVLIK